MLKTRLSRGDGYRPFTVSDLLFIDPTLSTSQIQPEFSENLCFYSRFTSTYSLTLSWGIGNYIRNLNNGDCPDFLSMKMRLFL